MLRGLGKTKGGKGAPPSPANGPVRQYRQRLAELTQQQQLPYELLLHIFSYLEDRNDVLNLCRCSRMLQSIAEVYLYRDIQLSFEGTSGQAKRALKLLDTIQNPHFSHVVMEMRVKFQPCRSRIDMAKGETLPKTKICQCGTIDKMLGTALQSMNTLELLHIECFLCMNLSMGRHHYLPELGTRKLRELRYECHCTMGNSFDVAKVFLAPWTQSITSLNWQTNLWTSIPEVQLQQLMKNNNFIPNVETLQYGGPGICDELLTKRMIRRLSAPAMDPSASISRHPNRKVITHLSINEHYVKMLLTNVGNINHFRNLQHVGTLPFSHCYNSTGETMLNHVLELIVDLNNLISIDACMRIYKPEDDPWDQQLLARLETVHPKLRRVFLSGSHTCVWVLGALGTWERLGLPKFTSWDMVTGVYDSL